MSGQGHSNNRIARAKLGLVSHDNTGGYFIVECQGCGIVYPSFQCGGGDAIADTGDYNDAICPHCSQESPEECSNVGLVWNTQQLKINELQQRLTAADERADVLEGLLREVQKSARKQDWASGYPTLFASVDAALKPAEGVGDDTTLEEDREDFKKVFVRINTKQGQSISLADMIARYEKKP